MKAASHLLALRTRSQNGWILAISFELALKNRVLSLLCTPSQTFWSLTFLCSSAIPSYSHDRLTLRSSKLPWVLASSKLFSFAFIFPPTQKWGCWAALLLSLLLHSSQKSVLPVISHFILHLTISSICSWTLCTCSKNITNNFVTLKTKTSLPLWKYGKLSICGNSIVLGTSPVLMGWRAWIWGWDAGQSSI